MWVALPDYKADVSCHALAQRSHREIFEVLNSYRWVKAVVLRDPAERALSAWLDKFRGENPTNVGFAPRIFGINRSITFDEYVDLLSSATGPTGFVRFREQGGGKSIGDPHIYPQTWFCGLELTLRQYDFIGRLDRVAEFTRDLLDHAGLWEPWGRTFYENGGNGGGGRRRVQQQAGNVGPGVPADLERKQHPSA